MEKKDWLDIIDIVFIPLILALFAVFWPAIQNWHRRRIFTKLILRELSEISPYHPKENEKYEYNHWWKHSTKTFIHKKIFDQANENRDFILSLDPDLVYYVSQLWDSLDKKNDTQFSEVGTDKKPK